MNPHVKCNKLIPYFISFRTDQIVGSDQRAKVEALPFVVLICLPYITLEIEQPPGPKEDLQ
jgi:hypothetical protein